VTTRATEWETSPYICLKAAQANVAFAIAIANIGEYIFIFDNLFAEAEAEWAPHGGTNFSGLSILRNTSIVPARQLTSQA
jgi:hypothetical protein